MKNNNKVMACVDQSHFADYVADYAVWAARRMNAPLEFLYVIGPHSEVNSGKDRSGAIGMDAQEELLIQLATEDGARTKTAREQGRVFLNRLRERALAKGGVSVDVRQRRGELEQTLVQQEKDVHLLVLGRRGEAAEETSRKIGRNVERVVRALHKPILAVTEKFKEPQRVMIAFDGGTVTRRGVEMVAASPLFRGLPIHLLMSGNENHVPKHFEWAKDTLESAGFEVIASLIPGDPESVIAKTVLDQSIDLLVMGAYSHSPWRTFLFGSKTADLFSLVRIPTLLLR